VHESLEDDGEPVAACGKSLVRSFVSKLISDRLYSSLSRDILYELTSVGELPLPQPSPPADPGREHESDTPFTSGSELPWNQNKILGTIAGSFPNEPLFISQKQRSPELQQSIFNLSPNAGSPYFSLPVYSNELGRLPLQSFGAQAPNPRPQTHPQQIHPRVNYLGAEGGEGSGPTPFVGPGGANSSYGPRRSGTLVPHLQQQRQQQHTPQRIPTDGFSTKSGTAMAQGPYGRDSSETAASMSFESMMETLSHTQLQTLAYGLTPTDLPRTSTGSNSMENVYSGMIEDSDPMSAGRHSTSHQHQGVPRQGELFYPFTVDNDAAAIWSNAPTGFECVIFVLLRR
jgi:hypothetical protein